MTNVHRIAILASGLVLALGFQTLGAERTPQGATPAGVDAAGQKALGQKIENFELRDFRGKSVALDEFKQKRAVVIAFLGTECPLATLYAPRLQQLADRFAEKDVAFLGINANQQDSISELAQYAKVHEIKFPLLKDVGNVVADRLARCARPKCSCSTRTAWSVTADGSTTSTSSAGSARSQRAKIWPKP